MPSGRPKGTKNRYWSKEEKLKIVKDMLENNLGEKVAGKKYGIEHSLVGKWRRNYIEFGEEGEASDIFSNTSSFGFFTKISAYAFMIFNLFSAPCFGAIGAMRRELGSRKKMLLTVLFQTTYAWLIATIFYQIASRIKTVNIANLIIITLLIVIIITIIIRTRKHTGCENCPYCDRCGK